ncbi:MAG: hypothetical protein AB7E13_10460 [Arcobacteraceae bacterium]
MNIFLMKYFFIIAIGIAVTTSCVQGDIQPRQQLSQIDALYGVKINTVYRDTLFFPKKWLQAPIFATGKQISPSQLPRALSITDTFLSQYPLDILHKHLHTIFFLEELSFYSKKYGGTSNHRSKAIYITVKEKTHSDDYLLGLMHSEFSSILFHSYTFPTKEWESLNPASFKYVGKGHFMLGQTDLYGQSEILLKQGFLVKYSQANVENDFNQIVRWLFTKPNDLALLMQKYPIIKAKVALTIRFYRSIDPAFTFLVH